MLNTVPVVLLVSFVIFDSACLSFYLCVFSHFGKKKALF